jgi:hypothetical protein
VTNNVLSSSSQVVGVSSDISAVVLGAVREWLQPSAMLFTFKSSKSLRLLDEINTVSKGGFELYFTSQPPRTALYAPLDALCSYSGAC